MKNTIKNVLSITKYVLLFIFIEPALLTLLKIIFDISSNIICYMTNLKDINEYIALFGSISITFVTFILMGLVFIGMVCSATLLVDRLSGDSKSHTRSSHSIKTKPYDSQLMNIEKEKDKNAKHRR